ncbi:MAG: DUF4124 domain-containing protein [Gammaproteobacteria bacterium]
MKLSIKLLLFTLVLALGAPFILKEENGRPLMDGAKLHMPQLGMPPLPDLATVKGAMDKAQRKLARLGGEETASSTVVYKWRDAQGSWHFSGDPPSGVTSERIVIKDGDANIIHLQSDATKTAMKNPEQKAPATTLGSPLAGAGRLLDQARGMDRMVQERHARQQDIIDQQSR